MMETIDTEDILNVIRKSIDDENAMLRRDDFLEDVGVDSIAGFEIRLLVKERWGVELSEEAFDDLYRVGDLVDLVRGQAAGSC
ncbi:acyl carrier protein [Nocardiopsis alkaliphila]|uniref:acyl carrier protein n=1 Tax=Nocardiopsis alkaliphila TaxID=225762 RepID=UPI000349A5F7|nr:acyl carrier protein [Nocardiopsis alkaliphila]